jgi:oxygen-independent coproporphyrinogen-3 oxidase
MEPHLPGHPLSPAPLAQAGGVPAAVDGPGALARAESGPGLYVHVPFCAARCDYCDFATGAFSGVAVDRYLDALELEMARRESQASSLRFRSVFFGGGTPSALPARHFLRLWAALQRHFTIEPGAEITLEVNPESARDSLLAAWRGAGVNRLSFGVQSFHDDELEALGRIHDSRRPAEAFARARAHGFERLSLDLMFAFPGHTIERWSATLDAALALEPEHLSAYAFIVEAGTPLGNAVLRAEQRVPEPEAQADAYALLGEKAARAGLGCYETSNFCHPDAESRHNLGYWLRRPYLGLGPSAHGLVNGARYANHWSLDRWAESLERGLAPESERELETPASAACEMLLLGLRLGTGVRPADYSPASWNAVRTRYGRALEAAVASGRLEAVGGGFQVAARHRFVADDVIAWIDARAARPFDSAASDPIIPRPCPSPLSPAA